MAPDKGATPLCFSVLKPDHGATEVIERDIILEAPIAIEYNGIYWHSELYVDKDYHLNKTEARNEHCIFSR